VRTIPRVHRKALRIIEPNLIGASGHYAEFVRAVARRSADHFSGIEVMCDAAADPGSLADEPGVRLARRFPRAGRKAEEWRAYRECAAGTAPFLLLTARTIDAMMLATAAMGRTLRQANLYFHWRESGAVRRAAAAACRRLRREALAIAPTPATAEFLRATGWARVDEIPYPALAPSSPFPPQPCPRLLVAGAARANKGIDAVAGLAARLAAGGDEIEMLVQTTGKRRSGRSGQREAAALERLASSGMRGLRLDPLAPDRPAYEERFRGALTLTPYDPAKFADNVSGIALDSLLHGAPVVATAGTWQARIVARFGAGTVMRSWEVDSLAEAVDEARRRWPEVCAGAQRAAAVLAAEHDPIHLVRALARGN
jgi:hypothetical protein